MIGLKFDDWANRVSDLIKKADMERVPEPAGFSVDPNYRDSTDEEDAQYAEEVKEAALKVIGVIGTPTVFPTTHPVQADRFWASVEEIDGDIYGELSLSRRDKGDADTFLKDVEAKVKEISKIKKASLNKKAEEAEYPELETKGKTPPPSDKMEEGLPIAEPKKPTGEEPTIKLEPGTHLEKEQAEIENARSLVQQMWKLLTEEASEGGYKEVKVLLDGIKNLEAFIEIETTGKVPKGTKAGSIKLASKMKDFIVGIIDELEIEKVGELGRPLSEQEFTVLVKQALVESRKRLLGLA